MAENEVVEYSIEEDENGKWCVYEGESKVKSFDTQEEAQTWLDEQSDEEDESGDEAEMTSHFTFTELSKNNVRKFDGMEAGSFVDMRGKEVSFSKSELRDYLKNTNDILESTRSAKGELVGLPIDENNHDHNGGAGWIVGLSLDERRGIIEFSANWTERGVELIGKNMRRYFSPTIDINNKVILGGSLTNWPATRTPQGHMLLRPVELSMGMSGNYQEEENTKLPNINLETLRELGRKVLSLVKRPDEPTALAQDDEPTVGDTETNLSEGVNTMPNDTKPNGAITELLNTPEAIAELGRMAEEKAQVVITAERRKRDVVEFASTLVGGTKDRPFGLPVPAEEVVGVLLSLPEDQEKHVRRLLTKTLNAAINFAERGYASKGSMSEDDLEFFSPRPRLDETSRRYLSQWIDSGRDAKSFFEANPELGEMTAYNLAEFTKLAKK